MYRLFFLWFISFEFLSTACSQGYQIEVEIKGMADAPVILGHYLNRSMYPDDTVHLNAKAYGVFTGKKSLPGGVYIMYLPNGTYFELLLDKDQEFSLKTDTAHLVSHMVIKGSEDNELFFEFQKFMIAKRETLKNLQDQKAEADSSETEDINDQLKAINEEVNEYRKKQIDKNNGTFFAVFLKATMEVEVPGPSKDKKDHILDSTWQYHYYKNHYFDNLDIGDPRLLRTPLYEDRLMKYITQVIPQIPDSIIPELDMLIEKSRADSNLFRYMLITLFNHYGKSKIMGFDAIQVHLAEEYYVKEAWWSDPEFIEDLKEKVSTLKPNLIGKTAQDVKLLFVPDEHFKAAAKDTALKRYPHAGNFFNLSEVRGKYILLIFWETDCGHCIKDIPKLHKNYINELKDKGVVVVAVSTMGGEEGKIEWVDFVNKHQLYGWINAWNPYEYTHKVKYNVVVTPTVYLLDENKTIVAKKFGLDQVGEIVDVLDKQHKPDFTQDK